MTEELPAGSWDVIVIGAGIAGLSAARMLAEAGRHVLVLEAQERIGGRLLTIRDSGSELPIELGAEFIHGRPQDLLNLIAEAGLSTYELDGDSFCWADRKLDRCEESEAFQVLSRLESYRGPDISFLEYLNSQAIQGRHRERAVSYVEGFNAADANEVSVRVLIRQQQAEDASEGDRLFRVREGYSAVAEYQHKKLKQASGALRLGTPVISISWQKGKVQIGTGENGSYSARKVVITVPLGVLQAGSLRVEPVPAAAFAAAQRLAMGPVQRAVFIFRKRFWASQPEREKLSFLFAEDGVPRVWWTPYPSFTPTLTAWIGGTQAGALEAEALMSSGLQQLSNMFSLPASRLQSELKSCRMHDWQLDPWTRGAYSYARVGGADASDHLAIPVEHTLFFAGEHTDTGGDWGTVHAAYRSGMRAARQALTN